MKHYSRMRGWLFLLSFIITFVATSFAPESGSSRKKLPADWTLLAQKDGIEVSYKSEPCEEGQRILFLIRNNNLTSQNVEFECRVTNAGNDIVFPSIINSVEGNGTLEGSCSDLASQSTFIALPEGTVIDTIVLTIK